MVEENKDFENGRKIQKLEDQLSALHEEVLSGSGKDNPDQRTHLRKIADEAFQSYLELATQYMIHPAEIYRVKEVYRQTMGLPKDDPTKPSLVRVFDDDIPF